jgi:hypothetical protein
MEFTFYKKKKILKQVYISLWDWWNDTYDNHNNFKFI